MKAEELFTEAALKAVEDESKWYVFVEIEKCAVCEKPFDEDEAPLHLWTDDGKKMISFHFECALKQNARDDMDKMLSPEMEGINFWKKGFKECPDCGGLKFLEGPHGGLSVNFKCAGCGSTFNWLGPFGIERI